jgi:copper oxidase (laccase) domain-containing protein
MPVKIAVSTVNDGLMKSPDRHFRTTLDTRHAFLQKNSIDPDKTTLVNLVYEGDNYTRYSTINDSLKGDGITRDSSIIADALVVTKPNHALLLPLADCIGAVVHDPIQSILMLSHLGRHNLEQYGGTRCIEYLVEKHSCDPKNLTIWLSPAAGADNYPLFSFNNRSMHDVAAEQFIAAGVASQNITTSPIDTTFDHQYFSHSQFLVGNRDTDGRHAVVAMMC